MYILESTDIYYLVVPTDQDSLHCSAGFSTQGFTRLQSRR